jgi:AraC-like DNA-binding protein
MVRMSGQRDFRIQGVVQVLSNDPFRTLLELAHDCQISSSRLSHLFKDEIGINVKYYRLDCRLQMAAETLVSTNRPIKEIAYSAGYRHCTSFVRTFRTHFGSSPTCCRKKQLEHATQQHLLTNSKRC